VCKAHRLLVVISLKRESVMPSPISSHHRGLTGHLEPPPVPSLPFSSFFTTLERPRTSTCFQTKTCEQ